MNKYFLPCALLLVYLTACNEEPGRGRVGDMPLAQEGWALVRLRNAPDSGQVQVGRMLGDVPQWLDTLPLSNGQVAFEWAGLPAGLYLLQRPDGPALRFFHDRQLVIEADWSLVDSSVQVHHSPENQLFDQYKKEVLPYYAQSQALQSVLSAFALETPMYASALEELNRIEAALRVWQQRLDTSQLLAGQYLAVLHRPVFANPQLTEAERAQLYQRALAEKHLNNPRLLPTDAYPQVALRALGYARSATYSPEQQEVAYRAAMERLLAQAADEPQVRGFLVGYLANGLRQGGMDALADWLAATYGEEAACQLGAWPETWQQAVRQTAAWRKGEELPDFALQRPDGSSATFWQVGATRPWLVVWSKDCPHCLDLLGQLRLAKPLRSTLVALDATPAELAELVASGQVPPEVYALPESARPEVVAGLRIRATPTVVRLSGRVLADPVSPPFQELLE